jgi:DNA-binding HxlR family transcriptional regulator
VEYELTKVGRTLLEPVQALAAWAEEHRFEMQAARNRDDERNARANKAPARQRMPR